MAVYIDNFEQVLLSIIIGLQVIYFQNMMRLTTHCRTIFTNHKIGIMHGRNLERWKRYGLDKSIEIEIKTLNGKNILKV